MKPRTLWWVQVAVLVLAPVLAYLPSINSPMTHYDDSLYLWDNVKRIGAPGLEGFLLQWNPTVALTGGFVEFFPLRDTFYWAIYRLWALAPLPYHVTSLFFHVTAVLLLWRFLRALSLSERASWFAALLFALHPVHIESVVWIAGMKDPMFVSFMLAALWSYQSYRLEPRPWKYAVMLLALCAGFLVKALIVSAFPIMLLMEFVLPPKVVLRERIARLFGPGLISALFFAHISIVGRANGAITGPHHGSWMTHWVLVFWVQAKYLKQALLPTSYRLIYCFEPAESLADPRLWVGVAAVVGLAVLAWFWRRKPLQLFFVGFYVAAILPVANVLPFPAIMADRYLYMPSLAICALGGLLVDRLRPRTFSAATALVLVLLTGATASRAWVWNTEELLWEEPDLDPACVVDRAFPAAQSHVLRYFTSSDRHEGLAALKRAVATPGFKSMDFELGCTTIISAAGEAWDFDEKELATTWARTATRFCPYRADAWNVAMVVNLVKNPEGAAAAARRAWRLSKMPATEALMWLTRLSFEPKEASEGLGRLTDLRDASVCWKIKAWADDHPESLPLLADDIEKCADVPEMVVDQNHPFLGHYLLVH